MKDQWVPCSPKWLEKYPGACAESPWRPSRQGSGVSHYHMESGPPNIEKLAKRKRVELNGLGNVIHPPTESMR